MYICNIYFLDKKVMNPSMDMITRCLQSGHDMFLREVFLNLPMDAIKTSRLVHSSWDSFITRNILRNSYGCSVMEKKVDMGWKQFELTERRFILANNIKILSLAYGDEKYACLKVVDDNKRVLDVENLRTSDIVVLYDLIRCGTVDNWKQVHHSVDKLV